MMKTAIAITGVLSFFAIPLLLVALIWAPEVAVGPLCRLMLTSGLLLIICLVVDNALG